MFQYKLVALLSQLNPLLYQYFVVAIGITTLLIIFTIQLTTLSSRLNVFTGSLIVLKKTVKRLFK
jgi:hypothetical protein